MTEYTFEITTKFSESAWANSKNKAREMVKENFYEDFGIDIEDSEMKLINVYKE